jgi:hypothetical protein
MWRGSDIRRLLAGWPLRVIPFVCVCGFAAGLTAADRIVLRNLKTINDPIIVSMNEDGVALTGGQVIGWDDIERITVSATQQEKADQLLRDLGDHLYRIRQRLNVGDYEGLLPHAEAVYPRYMLRNSKTAYMVKQATMWALLATGRREEAVAPYLGCYEYIRLMEGRPLTLPGQRRLVYDKQTGMTPDLQPVWFDPAAAKKVLPQVRQAATAMKNPLPLSARIYYASLALAAGERDAANAVLKGVKQGDPISDQLVALVKAQAEVVDGSPGPALSALETSLESFSRENRPAAHYWLGATKVAAPEKATQQAGILQLLHIPAIYGETAPELAGAALYEAMTTLTKLGDEKGAVAIRKELLDKYGHTCHANRVENEN